MSDSYAYVLDLYLFDWVESKQVFRFSFSF